MNDGWVSAGLGWILKGKPRTYTHAWLFAAMIAAVWLIVFSIFGIGSGWHQPWLAFAVEPPGILLIIFGLAMSYDVHRRRERSRHMSTEN